GCGQHILRLTLKRSYRGVQKFQVIFRSSRPKQHGGNMHGPVAGSPLQPLQTLGNMLGRRRLAATVAQQYLCVSHQDPWNRNRGEDEAQTSRLESFPLWSRATVA